MARIIMAVAAGEYCKTILIRHAGEYPNNLRG
jgi:hypothetical protein